MTRPPANTRRRRGLKPSEPLLTGRLRLTLWRKRPMLLITVNCPWCHDTHEHGWDDPPFASDQVEHRWAHCPPGSPFSAGGYWIGLDPLSDAENKVVVADWHRLDARLRDAAPTERPKCGAMHQPSAAESPAIA